RHVVVWIDDLQWAQEQTLHLLKWLVERGKRRPAGYLLVLSYRLDDADTQKALGPLRALDHLGLELAPLPPGDMAELLAKMELKVPAALAATIPGYPILVRFLDGRSGPVPGDPGGDLSARINAKLEALLPNDLQRRLVNVLSVSIGPVPLRVLSNNGVLAT